jgi:type II secretory pathway predicted ATPase ExeA
MTTALRRWHHGAGLVRVLLTMSRQRSLVVNALAQRQRRLSSIAPSSSQQQQCPELLNLGDTGSGKTLLVRQLQRKHRTDRALRLTGT